MEDLKFYGVWKIPEGEFFGELYYDGDSWNLKLFSALFPNKREQRIISGKSVDGEKFTLYKCFIKKYEGEKKIATYYVNVVFRGVSIEKEEDLVFNRFLINYSQLSQWMGNHLEEELSCRKCEPTPYKKESLAKIDENRMEISLILNKERGLNIPKKTLIITCTAYVSIELSKGCFCCFDKFIDIIKYLQNLFTLLIEKPVYPEEIRSGKEIVSEYSKSSELRLPIQIYLKQRILPNLWSIEGFGLSYEDISPILNKVIDAWFKMLPIFKPVFDLYFGVLYNSEEYIQNQFLNIMQAIESFHRRKFKKNGEFLPDEIYEKIKIELEKVLQDKIKECNLDPNTKARFINSFKNKLKYGNEFSLRIRLKDLINKNKEIFFLAKLIGFPDALKNILESGGKNMHSFDSKELEKYIGGLLKKPQISKDDISEFVQEVVNKRNYLVHYSQESSKENEEDNTLKLIYLTKTLKEILRAWLLIECNVPWEKIREKLIKKVVSKYSIVFS